MIDPPAKKTREASELETLLIANQNVIDLGERDEAISLILKAIQALCFDRVKLYVLRDDGISLVGVAHVGMDPAFVGSVLGLDDLPLSARGPGPILLDKKSPAKRRRGVQNSEVDAGALVPVWVGGNVIGAIVVDNRPSGTPYFPEALRKLPLLAAQVATIILNDRYKTLERKASNLQTVLQSYSDISSKLDLDQTLKAVCESAVGLLNVDHSGLALFDPDMKIGKVYAEYPDIGARGIEIPLAGVEAEESLINSDKPIVITDVENATSLGAVRDILMKLEIRSILIVTVVSKGRILGSFSLDSINQKREFTSEEIELCRMFATKVAVALENSTLFEETKNRALQLETLRRTTLAITSPGEPREVLNTITRHALELLNGKTGGIYKYYRERGERGELEVIADCNQPYTVGTILQVGEGMAGRLVLTGDDFMIMDNYNEWEGAAPVYKGKRLFEATLEVPLKWRNEIIGILYVDDKLGRKFTREDAHLLKLFADQAAIALVHSELSAENKAKYKQVNLLLKASNIVAHADNLANGLQHLAEMVVSLLRHSFCRILVLNESKTELIVEAAHPIQREVSNLKWQPGRGERVAISDYEPLLNLLDIGDPKVCVWSDRGSQKQLRKLAKRLSLNKIDSLLLVPIKIQNELVGLLDVGELRTSARVTFTPDTIELAAAIASNISVLIKRLRLHEVAERRRELLASLDEKSLNLRAEKETEKLEQEAVRLAVQLVSGSSGILFTYRHRQAELESKTTYESGVPAGLTFRDDAGILGQVARSGKAEIIQGDEQKQLEETLNQAPFETAFVMPIKRATGEVRAVLLVMQNANKPSLIEAEFEVLERFAAQISIALETSELMSEDERIFRHLNILHQISDYVQVAQDLERVLDALLTGITAGYGLGFNRAAVLLLDEREQVLVGRRGIGHLELEKVEESWRVDHREGLYNFKVYLEYLDKNALPTTPIGQRIRQVRVPVAEDRLDPLSRTVLDRRLTEVPVDKLQDLPNNLRAVFRPTSKVIVAPLIVRDRVIGVLVADNKFTEAPITQADKESLLTFTTTAAIAIDNINLVRRVQIGREGMRRFFKASSALSTSKDPQAVLEDIVAQTRAAAKATWVRLILSDEMGRARTLITKGTDNVVGPDQLMRPDGIGIQVLRSEKVEVIENTNRDRRMNPKLLQGTPESFLCLPLALQGKKFGVMWINYAEPRTFTEFDIDALQLYVNQAAIAYDGARRMEELSHMRRAAEALAEASDPQDVLRQIVESAHSALQADSAAIWPYDSARNTFMLENFVASNIPAEFVKDFGKAKPRPSGTARTVMERKWLVVEDIARESYEFLGDSTRKLLASTGVQSFIGTSLTVGDERLGVLYLNYNRTRNFNQEEEQLARTFANHAALALKKAKLLQQVTKAKKAAEAVARVTVLGNRPTTLQSIAEEMQKALDCSAVILFEYDKETQKLQHPPTMVGVTLRDRASGLGRVDPESIVYLMLERDRPYVVENAAEDELFHDRRFAIEEKIKSCIAVPLRVMNDKVGVIFVNYRHYHSFTPDEIDNINLFAHQAAVAIRNAQLFDERNSQLRRQGMLVKLSEELLSTPTLQDTLDRAVRFAADMLNADYANIVLPDRHGDLIFGAAYGWPQDMVGTYKVPAGNNSQTGHTIETGKPVRVDNYREERRFNVVPLVFSEGIHSGISVPMVREDKIIGAILVHSKTTRHFTNEDEALLSLVANETAIAVKSAEQYEQTVRKSSYLRALHEASKAINSSFGPDLRSVLDEIVKQAVEGISGIEGPKAILGNIMILDVERNILMLESLYLREANGTEIADPRAAHIAEVPLSSLRAGWPFEREQTPNGRIGITGRAAIERKAQLVRDVDADPDFVKINKRTKSELAVPLIDAGRVLGVLNVESDQPGGFDMNDETHLTALADLAVIAIRNAERFHELTETKGLVGARTALAWMGMATNAWRHAIEGNAINIRDSLKLMKDLDLASEEIGAQERQKLNSRIEKIDRLASNILEKKITPPLSSEEGVEDVLINDLLRERILQLWQNEPYDRCEYELQLAKADIKLRLSPEWFRRALDILVDNAIEAMENLKTRKLTITTILPSSAPHEVWIDIADTGIGMDEATADKIFKENIQTPNRTKGFGVGLLMVEAIVHTYNGRIKLRKTTKIELKETTPHGTAFTITFPLAG
jgi:GAF domain-containing protein